MARPKRIRWECPSGKHPAVLGSTRPRADATVRYCLRCSEEQGRLVKRTAPALESRRAAKDQTRRAAAAREREREAAAYRVTLLDYDGGEVELDVRELLRAAWQSEELRARWSEWHPRGGRAPMPTLTVRRSAEGKGRGWLHERRGGTSPGPARERDQCSGHAKCGRDAIVVTVGPRCGREWMEATIVHEAAHSACRPQAHHDGEWRRAYWRTMRELYGVGVVLGDQPTWKLDEEMAEALRAAGRLEPANGERAA